MRMRILGVRADAITHAEALAFCRVALKGDTLRQIVTANPEMVLAASRSPPDRTVIEQAGLVLVDGIGLALAARLRARRAVERISGVDFAVDLCRMAAQEGKTVYLLGGRPSRAEGALAALQRRVPGLQGAACTAKHSVENVPASFWGELSRYRPAVLFVAYGAPAQERWIAMHRERLEAAGVRIAIGVGGAFDMLSMNLPRAPRIMRAAGLEWLWRLALEPQRFSRVARATIVFPLAVLREYRRVVR